MVILQRTSKWGADTGVYWAANNVLLLDLGRSYVGDIDVFTLHRFTKLYVYNSCTFLHVSYTSMKSFKILICLNKLLLHEQL